VYGIALGYEDLCDHEELRKNLLLAVLAGKRGEVSPPRALFREPQLPRYPGLG